MGLREEILAAKDIHIEALEIPEWGKTIRLRSLSGRDRYALDAIVIAARATGKPVSIPGLIVAFSVIDDEGKRVFTDEDAALLDERNQGALDRIWDWHVVHSGLGRKALEEAKKNSLASPNDSISINSLNGSVA